MANIAATATGENWKRTWAEATATEAVPERLWRRRLRYWLNSFRGFAVFDVRGIDDRVRP